LGVFAPSERKDRIPHSLVQRSVSHIFAPYLPGNELVFATPTFKLPRASSERSIKSVLEDAFFMITKKNVIER